VAMEKEKLDRNFGLILHDVARLLRTEFDRRVKELGLTRSQWWVLTYLFREDGLTQTELANLMELQKASLGRLLDRLENKNWIRREADPNDRRANRIFLTKDVEPVVKEMRAHAASVRRDALSGQSKVEQEQFVDTLLVIKQNLSAMDLPLPETGKKDPAPVPGLKTRRSRKKSGKTTRSTVSGSA